MKHWHMDDVSWDKFDPGKVDPEIVKLVRAAAMVERNAADYTTYLSNVFRDDPDFRQAADAWSIEEIQHGDALGRWGELAAPGWNYADAFQRYRDGYKIQLDAETSIRGSRTGELIARCMVETGTSSYYTALADATDEPVLKQICLLIAADEYRHFKLFYDHMRRYLQRENLSVWQRLKIAVGRVGESEDDELAFAFHCGNEPVTTPFDHHRCTAAYLGRALQFYQEKHIERATGMLLKVVGLPPRGRIAALFTWLSFKVLRSRQRRMAAVA
jgi:rubrerythrin